MPSTTAPQVHGHEVITMMTTATEPYTRESLVRAIIERFGATARFYTCSASDMTAPQLIGFLAARGKFTVVGDRLALDPARVCQH